MPSINAPETFIHTLFEDQNHYMHDTLLTEDLKEANSVERLILTKGTLYVCKQNFLGLLPICDQVPGLEDT